MGQWTGKPYKIELKLDVTSYHSRPFVLPKCYEKTLREKVECLCKIGVLRRVNLSERGAPTFIFPKKDQTIRFISDFCELNNFFCFILSCVFDVSLNFGIQRCGLNMF